MEWLDLVAPSAAILALFGALALIIVTIRQGRAIRRLEDRLSRVGEAAADAPLQRIAELQARHAVSEGIPPLRDQMRRAGMVALSGLVLVVAIAGVWYLLARDSGGGGGTAAGSTTPAATTAPSATTANPPEPVETTVVPDTVPALADPGLYDIAVFNASGVDGIASTVVAPALMNEGYQVPVVDNPPDGVSDRTESVVMWSKGNKRVAWNVAKVLGIRRAPPIDGYTPEQVGNADVVVLVGLDIAEGGISSGG